MADHDAGRTVYALRVKRGEIPAFGCKPGVWVGHSQDGMGGPIATYTPRLGDAVFFDSPIEATTYFKECGAHFLTVQLFAFDQAAEPVSTFTPKDFKEMPDADA